MAYEPQPGEPPRSVKYSKEFEEFAGQGAKPSAGAFSRGFTSMAAPESEAQNLRDQGHSEVEIRDALAASGIPYTPPDGAGPEQAEPRLTPAQVEADIETEQAEANLRRRYPRMLARMDPEGRLIPGGLDMPS